MHIQTLQTKRWIFQKCRKQAAKDATHFTGKNLGKRTQKRYSKSTSQTRVTSSHLGIRVCTRAANTTNTNTGKPKQAVAVKKLA